MKRKKAKPRVKTSRSETRGPVYSTGHKLIEILILAFPVYFASRCLLHLGSEVVVLPKTWRPSMTIVGTAIAVGLFQFIRNRAKSGHVTTTGISLPDLPHGAVAERQTPAGTASRIQRTHLVASLFAIATIVLITIYLGMRSACVYQWPGAHAWIDNNLRTTDTTSHYSVTSLSFIDAEEHAIFIPIPLLRPSNLSHYLAQVKDDPSNDGLVDPVVQVLSREPDTIIDVLIGARMHIFVQEALFALLFLGILLCASVAAAFAYSPAEAVGELAADIAH